MDGVWGWDGEEEDLGDEFGREGEEREGKSGVVGVWRTFWGHGWERRFFVVDVKGDVEALLWRVGLGGRGRC